MSQPMVEAAQWTGRAAVFGATGGIGAALVLSLTQGGWRVVAGSRTGDRVTGAASCFAFDLGDEASIAAAASGFRDDPPDLVIVATGVLTLTDGTGPEKSFRQIDGDSLAQILAINTIGPALVAKHFLPLLPRDRRSVFAALGARVGSIGDNRLGGWHAYRASKAALAMLIRNFALEMGRTHPLAVVAGLHPGTVDTRLSEPFRRTIAPDTLQSAADCAARLVAVIQRLTPAESGMVVDWRGMPVPP